MMTFLLYITWFEVEKFEIYRREIEAIYTIFQVVQFSLQIINERIELRAKSLFTINNRLFMSILNGIATYLVA